MVSFAEKPALKPRPALSRLQQSQEEIFRQLQLLIPGEVSVYDCFRSRVEQSPPLHLEVLERHPYTQFIRLTYVFADDRATGPVPDAHIRLYQDARLAEVTAFNTEQGFARSAHPWYPQRPLLQRQWRENRALEKWLSYLLGQGHSFETMQPADSSITETSEFDAPVEVV